MSYIPTGRDPDSIVAGSHLKQIEMEREGDASRLLAEHRKHNLPHRIWARLRGSKQPHDPDSK